MKIIIARHGETEENKAGILQGHIPGQLSRLGIEQAKKLALRLKDEKIDYIYSSDLARAIDTAEEISTYHPKTPLEPTQELREMDLGKFTGRQKSELETNNQTFVVGSSYDDPGVESRADLHGRAERFVKDIMAKHPDATVLLVGHSGINRNLVSVITGERVENIPAQLNTSVNIFEIDADGGYRTEAANCIKHLD